MLLDDQYPTTTENRSSVAEDTEGELYIGQRGQRRLRQSKFHFDDGKTARFGWIYPKKPAIICHGCYEKGNVNPQCSLKLFQINTVSTNYESSSKKDLARVPCKA